MDLRELATNASETGGRRTSSIHKIMGLEKTPEDEGRNKKTEQR